ncbi:MAG: hypothetical protein AAFZ52_13045, partial [Bacteroidota bacterium]
ISGPGIWAPTGIALRASLPANDLVAGTDGATNLAVGLDLSTTVVDAVSFAVIDAAVAENQARNAIPVGAQIPGPENRYFWLDHALRLTTIPPGQKAFGKVVFPRNDKATEFSFQVSVEDKEFTFPFKQRVFRP